jgi:hypothetical protein
MKARHMAPKERRHRSRKFYVVVALGGAALAGSVGLAAANWVVSLATGSSGEAQSATVSNITIAAVASPAASNLLYPGGAGDVVATITNPNPSRSPLQPSSFRPTRSMLPATRIAVSAQQTAAARPRVQRPATSRGITPPVRAAARTASLAPSPWPPRAVVPMARS